MAKTAAAQRQRSCFIYGNVLGEWKERDGDGYENGNNIFSIIKRDGGYSGNLFPNASVFPPVRIGVGVLQDVPQEVAAGD